MPTRYAITHVNADGYRVLLFANQGRNHKETFEEAQEWLTSIYRNNSPDTFNPRTWVTMQVRPVECFGHGDAISPYGFEPTRKGTCHFVSKAHAVRYYASQGLEDAKIRVAYKINMKEIFIGPPAVMQWEALRVIKDEGRYEVIMP